MEAQSELDSKRITENLRRTAELTELCLALRRAVLRESHSKEEAERIALREILEAKERAWRQSRS